MKTRTLLTLCVLWLGIACDSSSPSASFEPDGSNPPEDALEQDRQGQTDGTEQDSNKPDPDLTQDQGPQPGLPCDDGDPCTYGESLDAEGECGGGTQYVCDDGRTCTSDSCDGLGDCLFVVAADACLIEGVCYVENQANPENACETCSLSTPLAWAAVPEGGNCSDGNACTDKEVCTAGVCGGGTDVSAKCDDLNPCTQDSCEPASGCQNLPLTGSVCPPPNACVTDAVCVQGVCTPDPAQGCDDANPCTADTCGPEGCENAPLDGLPCEDGDLCSVGDVCLADACIPGSGKPACEDGNSCTVDLCHPALGCYHELAVTPCCKADGTNVCDDGNFCTYDDCVPETGECIYSFHSLACNDFDVCTGPDVCIDGQCVGTDLTCDDGNPCTVDFCQPPAGCLHEALDGVDCDDGLECSTGDVCVLGKCKADMKACACQPTFSDVVNKINALTLGPDGNPPNGLDVDANPATCSPANKCSQGIDNALSAFAGLVGTALQDAVDSGSVVLLFEHRDFSASGAPYILSVYIGKETDEACDNTTTTCAYLVSPDSFNEECLPLVQLDNATAQATQLMAGGPGYNFPFQFPISDTAILEVTLYSAQIQGSVTYASGKPAVVTGVLGGAINKQQMLDAVSMLPPEVELPVDKALVIQMLNSLVKPDIDTDGDGVLDSASVGMPFTAHQAEISGMAAP